MKVFIYNGSPRGEKSLGYQFAKRLEDNIKTKIPNAVINYFGADQLNIKEVDGSVQDFISGETIFADDMTKIEKSMLESDYIVLISPVYAHNVSSQMKKLIDRLSYWLHIYRLIGKKGLVVSVSSDNGNETVNSYLTEMMEYWGVYVIGETSIQGAKLNKEVGVLESYASVCAKRILLSINETDIEIPNRQEENFQGQREKYLSSVYDSTEKSYWEENGFFEEETFRELFLKKMVEVHV